MEILRLRLYQINTAFMGLHLELRFVSLDFLVPAARNFLSDKISERYNIHSIRGLTLVVCLVT